MPIRVFNDENGFFVRFGLKGAKFYFNPTNLKSYEIAYDKALKQSRAIFYKKKFKH